MNETVNVVIGTPIYRAGAYILDRFLANQKEIQQKHPSSELVLATVEHDFADELEALLSSLGIRGKVLSYETIKPDHARSMVWDVACGREALRRYMLSQTKAKYMLCLDADMTYDPNIIEIMGRETQGYDVVFSGCPLRDFGTGLAGSGCMMLSRGTLEKVEFRCCEFKNGEAMSEDNLLEMDLFRLGSRIKKGFFLSISHYKSENEARHIDPRPVGVLRRIANSPLVRYGLIRASLIVHYNIPWKLKVLLNRFLGALGK